MYFLDAALIYDGVHLLAAALGQLSNVQELQVRLYSAQKTVFFTRNLRTPPPPPHLKLKSSQNFDSISHHSSNLEFFLTIINFWCIFQTATCNKNATL